MTKLSTQEIAVVAAIVFVVPPAYRTLKSVVRRNKNIVSATADALNGNVHVVTNI